LWASVGIDRLDRAVRDRDSWDDFRAYKKVASSGPLAHDLPLSGFAKNVAKQEAA